METYSRIQVKFHYDLDSNIVLKRDYPIAEVSGVAREIKKIEFWKKFGWKKTRDTELRVPLKIYIYMCTNIQIYKWSKSFII